MVRSIASVGLVLVLILGAGCGDDEVAGDPPATGNGAERDGGSDAGDQPADGDAGTPAVPSGGASVITVDGEEFSLGTGRCHLEDQPSAGGGGTIELTGQAEGGELMIDFTRFSEDDLFAGDDLEIDFFEPRADGVDRFSGKWDIGTVSLDGSTLVGEDLTVLHRASGTEATVSFRIEC